MEEQYISVSSLEVAQQQCHMSNVACSGHVPLLSIIFTNYKSIFGVYKDAPEDFKIQIFNPPENCVITLFAEPSHVLNKDEARLRIHLSFL